MIIDLRVSGKLGVELSKRMNSVADEIRSPFHTLIEELSRGNENNLDWWVSGPPSRNPHSSPLFHYCCCIQLIRSLISEGKNIESIIVDSLALQKILKRLFSESKQGPEIKIIQEPFFYKWTRIFKRALISPLIFFYSHCCAKTVSGKNIKIPESAILIDRFVQESMIDDDPYYSGMLDYIDEEDRKKVFFIPAFYKIPPHKLRATYSAVRNNWKNYLLKEDFLKIRDYFFAWLYVIRSNFLKISPAYFFGIDIRPLAKEEIRSLNSVGQSMTALLNYRFSYRLREKKAAPKLVINWFENQIVDKGWNAGFRKNFPEAGQIGFMGFLFQRYYLCLFPTSFEEASKVIPPKVNVIGKKLIETVKEWHPELKADIAPAFRYQHVWNQNKKETQGEFAILAALPLYIDQAVEIIEQLLDMYEILPDKNTRFLLKTHPTCSADEIKEKLPVNLPEAFHFADRSFDDCLGISHILISSGSGVLMESIARGVPVIIIGSANGLTHHTVPEDVDPLLWQICYTAEELAESVKICQNKKFNDLEQKIRLAEKVRKDYFNPVDKKNVREFLQLD